MPVTSWERQQVSMPPTVMAFVDAGYLTAGARAYLHMTSTPRIDGDGLVTCAEVFMRHRRGGQVLRAYVYDAQYPRDAPEYPEQRAYFDQLAAQAGIRLQLGHLTERESGTRRARWEQKGVGALLVLDMVRLAQLRAFDIAMVVAGDRDLAEALRVIADDHARRVYLFTVEGSPPADRLVQVADAHMVIEDHWLRMMVGQGRPAGNEPAAPAHPEAPEARPSKTRLPRIFTRWRS